MARQPRLQADNLLYHLYSRGNNRELVFFSNDSYDRFLQNLERFRIKFGYTLYAYCLLPNHFHLLLQVKEISLSKIMQVMMTAYTMYVNKKYNRVGHVFQGRFGSIIVDKDEYLLELLRYIHLNPVKAGLVTHPQEYPWSSYQRYIDLSKNNNPKLEISEVLKIFAQDTSRQEELFQKFTLLDSKEEFDPLKQHVRGVLGSTKFQQKLTKVFRGTRP